MGRAIQAFFDPRQFHMKKHIIVTPIVVAAFLLAAYMFKNHSASKVVQAATSLPVEVVEKTNEVEVVKAPAPSVTDSNNLALRVSGLSFASTRRR